MYRQAVRQTDGHKLHWIKVQVIQYILSLMNVSCLDERNYLTSISCLKIDRKVM